MSNVEMMQVIIALCFLLLCLFSLSQQCGCPAQFTQQIFCNSQLVVKARIESSTSDQSYTFYEISVIKFYDGEDEYKRLSNKTTLWTPKESAACGPVVFETGSKYILTVSVYDGIMSHNLCGLQVKFLHASKTLLGGLSGEYKKNCQCKIPYKFKKTNGRKSQNQCGKPPIKCSRETVCATDAIGQCSWQNC
ncbi:metalloproteinase inhibitor 3-like [Mytilus galloprovincialis]|uniref:metalloproteinase inhibitor 3-like n=1 Tax=Mytilus galloprovincialis TaxID=29158 RepID=UPI003F7C1591